MNFNQRIVVAVLPDERSYTWWIVDTDKKEDIFNGTIPLRAQANITTSATTLKNAIGTEMPTLAT